jgi:hypothetical protein
VTQNHRKEPALGEILMIQVTSSCSAVTNSFTAKLGIEADTENSQVATWSFIGVQTIGMLASLYFMWSVRHPKTD